MKFANLAALLTFQQFPSIPVLLGRLLFVAVVLVVLCLTSPSVNATDYFVSPSGDDQAAGTLQAPWHTLSRVNAMTLRPGDAVYLDGTASFTGNLVLNGTGTEIAPILISSYGEGRATVDSASQNAIYGYNTGGFRIENLILTNSGTSGYGISFFTDEPTGKKYPGITVDNVEFDSCPDDGINVGSWLATNPGWSSIRVINVRAHGNDVGMSTYGFTELGAHTYAIGEIYVADSEFYDNVESGLIVCGAAQGVVEYCSFHDNQSTGGFWTWGTSDIAVQHCISFRNLRGDANDGFGFDLDGGSQNCTIQYCLSYQNQTPGFVIFDYTQSAITKNNTIRYCISENDAREDSDWGSFEIFPWADTPIVNCHIYNCAAYLTSRNGKTHASGFLGYGKEAQSGDGSGATVGCSFRNNVLYLDGTGRDMRFLTCYEGATHAHQVDFQQNLYYSSQRQSRIFFGNQVYRDFRDWRLAYPRQEMLGPYQTGFVANPHLTGVGTAAQVADVTQLDSFAGYRPTSNSPCLGHGLNIRKLFGIDPGSVDFWGDEVPFRGRVSIGPSQGE